ncbi:MAG: rhomboid family intramembrane serine protease [Candidatus Thiodiazotropha sp.]|jgi:membrane associated rhomboid family serine protease
MNETPVVHTLLILCGLGFIAELGTGSGLVYWLALWPIEFSHLGAQGGNLFHPWQLISYAFLHGSPLHLVLNMYALWLFGGPLERRWGSQQFAFFYLICVIGAGLMHLEVGELALNQTSNTSPVIGASGGVFGVLLAFGMRYPNVKLMMLLPPIPIKAKWFVLGYGAIELIAGITGSSSGIAHFAHLGGMLTGFLLLRGSHLRFR